MSIIRPSTSVIVRPDLAIVTAAALSIAAGQAIADMVLPPVPVTTRTGQIWTVPAESILTLHNTKRERLGDYNRRRTKFTTSNFMCEERGLEEPVAVEDTAEYGVWIAGETAATKRCVDDIIRDREKAVADLCINETTFPISGTTGVSVGTAWTSASATPAANIDSAASNIWGKTGVTKDQLTLVIPIQTAMLIPFTTDFTTKMKLDTAGLSALPTTDQLRIYFGVKEVLLAGMPYNTADDNLTPSLTTIWNKNYCFLYYRMTEALPMGQNVDAGVPGLGCSPRWSLIDSGAGVNGVGVYSYPEDSKNAGIVRASQYMDEILCNSSYANLIKGVNP